MKKYAMVFFSFLTLDMSGNEAPENAILLAFQHGDFVPHVITDDEVTRSMGKVKGRRTANGLERVYIDKRSEVWLQVTIDSEASPEYRFAKEILISSIPIPGDGKETNEDLSAVMLKGICLGDSSDEVLRNSEIRIVSKRMTLLAGTAVEEIYANPNTGESDLFYRYYVKGSHVVGMAMGVTE